MAEIDSRPNDPVAAFLDGIENPGRRADSLALLAMMKRVVGVPAQMWGPWIVGFGARRIRFARGNERHQYRVGFAPRSTKLGLYVGGFPEYEALLARLGKHRVTKECLYLDSLADADPAVLEEIILRSYRAAVDVDHGP